MLKQIIRNLMHILEIQRICDFALFCRHLSIFFFSFVFFHSQILFLHGLNIQMSFFYKELCTAIDQNNNKQEIGK